MVEKNPEDPPVSKKLKEDHVSDFRTNSYEADKSSQRKPVRLSMEHGRRKASSISWQN